MSRRGIVIVVFAALFGALVAWRLVTTDRDTAESEVARVDDAAAAGPVSSIAGEDPAAPATTVAEPAAPAISPLAPSLVMSVERLAELRAAVVDPADPRHGMLQAIEAAYLQPGFEDSGSSAHMLVAAVAYALTDNTDYLELATEALVRGSSEECWDKSFQGQCRRDRLAGRRMVEIGLTLDLLSEVLDQKHRAAVKAALFDRACKQYEAATWGRNNTDEGWANWWYNAYTNNHYNSSIAGLAVAAMTLVDAGLDEPASCVSGDRYGEEYVTTPQDWLEFSIASLERAKVVWDQIDDGHWPEGDVYQLTAVEELSPALFALDRLYGTDFVGTPLLSGLPRYYLFDSMPDARWNNLLNSGDAFSSQHRTYRYVGDLRALARLNGDEVAQSLADEVVADLGGRPTAPDPALHSRHFFFLTMELLSYDPTVAAMPLEEVAIHRSWLAHDAGEAFMWSDRSDDAVVVSLHSGPPGGAAAFEIARSNYDGRRWAGDGSGPQEFKPATAHSHADANGFYLYGGGSYLILEAGLYRREGTPWASSTTAHNTITVGGQDQIGGCVDSDACTGDEEFVPYGAQDGYYAKDEYWKLGGVDLTAFATTANFDLAVGDASAAYADSEGVERFARHVVFVDRSYVVMADDIRLDRPNEVGWHLHTPDGAQQAGQWIRGFGKNDRQVGVGVLAPERFTFETSPVPVAPDYQHALSHLDDDGEIHQLVLRTSGSEPRFVTVFVPTFEGRWDDRPEIALLAHDDAGASVEVTHSSGRVDVTLINYGDADAVALGNHRLTGQAASVSLGSDGTLRSVFVAAGSEFVATDLVTSVDDDGLTGVLVTDLPSASTFEATFADGVMAVSGDAERFVAYAPWKVGRMTLETIDENHRVVRTEVPRDRYTQVGNYVYFGVRPPSP